MQKLFDKILSEKVKKVFNNHQEPYNPADWDKLKARLGKKKRTPIIWLNIAKAASVVLFIGLSTFYINKNDKNLQSEYIIPDNHENIINNNQVKNNSSATHSESNKESIYGAENEYVAGVLQKENRGRAIQQVNEIVSIKNAIVIKYDDSITIEKIIVDNNIVNNDTLIQTDQIQLVEQEFEIDKKERNSKFDFTVALASVYSYSSPGTEGHLNMGGGFTTSYNVSEKISISSGMIVGRQSLDYNSGMDMEGVYANGGEDLDANTTMVSDAASSKSTIQFVGIDIPLNIKYKTKKFIISTGLSSLVFINEKRTYSSNAMVMNTTFNTATNSYETTKSLANFQAEDKSPAFSRVEFASLLNISVGYKIPLQKGSILVEPFLKYPLGDISSAKMRIGNSGLSLHYYF